MTDLVDKSLKRIDAEIDEEKMRRMKEEESEKENNLKGRKDESDFSGRVLKGEFSKGGEFLGKKGEKSKEEKQKQWEKEKESAPLDVYELKNLIDSFKQLPKTKEVFSVDGNVVTVLQVDDEYNLGKRPFIKIESKNSKNSKSGDAVLMTMEYDADAREVSLSVTRKGLMPEVIAIASLEEYPDYHVKQKNGPMLRKYAKKYLRAILRDLRPVKVKDEEISKNF